MTPFACSIHPGAFAADSRDDGTWEFFANLRSASEEPISVRIITGPWEPSEHTLEKREGETWRETPKPVKLDCSNPLSYRIDGREGIWGADGFGWPGREVKRFVVRWGDRIVNVPRKDTRDYYERLLYTVEDTTGRGSILGCWTKADIDPETADLIIISNGGGGAGWYRAKWRIKPDGTIESSAAAHVVD